jgi:AraC family transcriptional regulator of adaptative response/methylated-DNA-[protein]-cysteine methyltransferase
MIHAQLKKFDTVLGPMMAIADEKSLYLLEFVEKFEIKNEMKRLEKQLQMTITSGETAIIHSIESEIADYFAGKIKVFKTPIQLFGTPFQQSVWEALRKIPWGETRSYLAIAKGINKPTAFRAVAQANGANRLAIIVPCHRVINADGALGGYSGGLSRKQWMLELENRC